MPELNMNIAEEVNVNQGIKESLTQELESEG